MSLTTWVHNGVCVCVFFCFVFTHSWIQSKRKKVNDCLGCYNNYYKVTGMNIIDGIFEETL